MVAPDGAVIATETIATTERHGTPGERGDQPNAFLERLMTQAIQLNCCPKITGYRVKSRDQLRVTHASALIDRGCAAQSDIMLLRRRLHCAAASALKIRSVDRVMRWR